jgi:N-methylhydantoinase A
MNNNLTARLAVDIGGTFTDVAVSVGLDPQQIHTAKTLTTTHDPVHGTLEGVRLALQRAGLSASDIGVFVHGTTLATNALIEKKGAEVAVVTTQGFRDILEIAYERRYDQYDLFLDKPDLLVPRDRCFTVPERLRASGEVLEPLDESSVPGLIDKIDRSGATSIAICLLHAYANARHEICLRELISAHRPELTITLSSEVSPEIREFDRMCTAVANAYIGPLMARYLNDLEQALRSEGCRCPLFMMTSGGGMTTFETAVQFPIRLVESGPSGGAILAASIARRAGRDSVVAFDMGGTTAKICLIDNGAPQTSRHFEIARAARFTKGSGLPVRIPVIEMIEIGAGGGSIAKLDGLGRVNVGPQSAGSEPGPACYGRGGVKATVTDSDLEMGFIDAERFGEGRLRLDRPAAATALGRDLGDPLGVDAPTAAFAVGQIVDENMASAARIHAVERGKDLRARTMIAFGGNGPLHACRIADRLGVGEVLIPRDPGVGSAIGFLRAQVSYEIVRSRYETLEGFDLERVNGLLADMSAEARDVVRRGAESGELEECRIAFMRYKGQGHEIEVELPARDLQDGDIERLARAYEDAYRTLFHRSVPGMTIEIMNWAVTLSAVGPSEAAVESVSHRSTASPSGSRAVTLSDGAGPVEVPVYMREDLQPGDAITGPALVVEPQTTTFIGASFGAVIDGDLNILMLRGKETG